MSPVASLCPVHGAFVSRAFSALAAQGVYMSGNIESCPYPECREDTAVMDGVFNFDERGRAVAVDAPAWSRLILDQVQGVLDRTADIIETDQSIPVEEALEQMRRELQDIRSELRDTQVQRDHILATLEEIASTLPSAWSRTKLASAVRGACTAALVLDVGTGLPASILTLAVLFGSFSS